MATPSAGAESAKPALERGVAFPEPGSSGRESAPSNSQSRLASTVPVQGFNALTSARNSPPAAERACPDPEPPKKAIPAV